MKQIAVLFILILLISCNRPTNKDIYYAYAEREKDRKEHPEKYEVKKVDKQKVVAYKYKKTCNSCQKKSKWKPCHYKNYSIIEKQELTKTN
jgi:hypothetical protein